MLRGEFRDPGRLAPAGMILPEPALGVQVLPPLRREGQRKIFSIHRERARSRGVDPDADDVDRIEPALPPGSGERAAHAFLQREEIISGMLAGQVVIFGVEQDALPAGRVVRDAAAEFRPVRTTDHERARRVGAVIEAEGEPGSIHSSNF